MFTSLSNFQPIKFLKIDNKLPISMRLKINQRLFEQAGEYVFLKLIEELPEDKIDEIIKLKNGKNQIDLLNLYIPDLEFRINAELENFRKAIVNDG